MNIINLNQLSLRDTITVGGKNASLGEMIQHLTALNIKVPDGFATTAKAYINFLKENNLESRIQERLATLDVNNLKALTSASKEIQSWIKKAKLPKALVNDIEKAYLEMNVEGKCSVAVRSSATAEDLPDASFAGQQETYLNISGVNNVTHAVKNVFASIFTPRSIAYRVHHGFEHHQVAISAGVQRMIRADKATSGVVFTLDTESGFDGVIFITAAYGLGETVVQGTVNPDEFFVHKAMLEQDKPAIIRRILGSKEMKMVFSKKTKATHSTVITHVSKHDQLRYCLTDDEILELAKQALIIEKHYQKPMDIEWAKDGITGEIFIVQARPETVKSHQQMQVVEQFHLKEKGNLITSGRSVGQRIGQGPARLIKSAKQMDIMQEGDVLVTDMTDPDWEPIMKRASAIVTNRGGRTCHAAIVARELGIPAVVGCNDATQKIKANSEITVSCAEGETGNVYQGKLKFELEKTPIDNLPELPFNICMNLGNPEQAFTNQFLPNHGVGLARLEFIISNMIGIHPNAILQLETLPKKLQKEILTRTCAYQSPKEFYIEKLVEGIATIAGAFYPKPVIVRFSDFKSNEYANLLGGEHFEPDEENPMLGYRGASRYLSKDFHDAFTLECEAIKRVRLKLGLVNTQVMFPFVRTLKEAQALVELLKTQDMERGKDDLKVYMMCEIPSNAIMAEQFLQYFDGYSIGSNDLTQLTLGLDRDSALIADLFDERLPAVKALLSMSINTCNKLGKYVGICGQGPSDHPDLAKWLMDQGIQSISLSPDSIVRTWLDLAKLPIKEGRPLL